MLLCCSLAVGSALAVGGLVYWRTHERTNAQAIESLGTETRLAAARFRTQFQQLNNDVFVISRTPPIQGMIRSTRNGGVDPLDQSTTELWRNRLETIFISLMEARPAYFQMRYIGFEDGGRELVRVDRRSDGFLRVPQERLQRKEHEPYFQRLLETGASDAVYSDVTYNREFGEVDPRMIPTVRVMLPVEDPQGAGYGIVIVNADYYQFLNEILSELALRRATFIVDEEGDVVHYDAETGASAFLYRDSVPNLLPVQGLLRNPSELFEERAFEGGGLVNFAVRVPLESRPAGKALAFVMRESKTVLLAPVLGTRYETAATIVIVVAFSLLIATLFARRITIPLREMTESIRKIKEFPARVDLPVEKQDEIGELARAFHQMVENLSRSDSFAYVASHDLKAPLRVIDNASQWLEEDLADKLDDESRDNLQLLRGRVRRMERLLDDLLEYSRVGRKQDERYEEMVSGKRLMDDILELTPVGAFQVKTCPEFDRISVPRMPLQQILMNLVGNAVKHHDGTKGLIEISVEEEGAFYRFEVKDDGPGIAPEYQAKVFEMFQTLKPRDRVEGSGMGLSIARKHVEYLGGTMTLESKEGSGCCFRFTLPRFTEK